MDCAAVVDLVLWKIKNLGYRISATASSSKFFTLLLLFLSETTPHTHSLLGSLSSSTPCTRTGYILLVPTSTENFISASTCGCSWKNPTGFVPCPCFWGLRLLPDIKAEAPCSATCQCDGCQKALLDICSNKTVVPAAVVSVYLWALKTRLLRSHNTARLTWNMMGVTAGATALISTVSEMSLHFLMHFTPISRSQQCPQPEGYESQDNSCRANLIFAIQGWKMKLGL